MTIVHGQIESLKRIRETLDKNGITRFNSISDIRKFIKNYDNEREELFFKIEREVDLELEALQAKGSELQKNYDAFRNTAITKLEGRINILKSKCNALAATPAKNPFKEMALWYQMLFFKALKFPLEKYFNSIVKYKTNKKRKILELKMKEINAKMSNRQATISERFTKKFREIEHARKVASRLNPLIAGAIGENLVQEELKKMSDKHVLFNDFSVEFEEPIYNRRHNDHIYSIQIDHLLVTRAGLFVIETKNWSKKSIARLDMRSPVDQIRRANFALFVILNSNDHSILKNHHWGDKKLPIKNIVVMINNKPKEEFKFVSIKILNELNDYINYFDPIFDDSEVRSIAEHLADLKK